MGESKRPLSADDGGYVLYEEELILVAGGRLALEPPEARSSPVEPHTVVGTFEDPQRAERVLKALKDAGFGADQVSVVARDGGATIPVQGETEMRHDAEVGAAGLGILGGLTGWLLGIGALTLPVIGEAVGIGILWATLAGAGIGAAAGGLGGALVGHGVDDMHAREYEERVRQGRSLVTVHARDTAQAGEAQAIFARLGGNDVRSYATDE